MKQRGLWALAWLWVWLGQASVPRVIADDALDPSWSEAIGHFLAQGLQAGKDWVFTYGPLGWFATVVDEPQLYWTRYLGFELVWRGMASAVLVCALWQRGNALQRACALLLLGLLPLEFDAFALALLAACLVLLSSSARAQAAWRWIPALLLASLALMKFTFAVAALAGLAVLCMRREWRKPAWDLSRTLLCAVLLWLSLGQGWENLLPWFQHSAQIAAAYGSGQSKSPPTAQLIFGVGTLLCAAGILWRDRSVLSVALAGATFVSFKAGFTRGDDHTPYYWGYAALAPWIFPGSGWVLRALGSALAVLALILSPEVSRPAPNGWPSLAWQRALHGVQPAAQRQALDEERARRAQRWARPRIQAKVGKARVDVYNHHQGVALLNGLNYQPRAIPHSYVAFTAALQALDVASYEQQAPPFVLFRLATIDDRFPMHEHAQLLELLRRGWVPALSERGELLLEQRPALLDAPTRSSLGTQALRFDEWLNLPDVGDDELHLVIKIDSSFAGRMTNLLYRSAELQMRIEDQAGSERAWRIVPELARVGFCVDPLVLGTEGFVALYEGAPRLRPKRLRLECPAHFRFAYQSEIEVELLRVSRIAAPMPGLAAQIGAGVFERMPVSVDAPRDLLRIEHEQRDKLFTFAPSSMSFVVQPTDRSVEAWYGLQSDPEGKTASTRVCVRAAWVEQGQLRLAFERWLDPTREPKDRGPQRLQLEIPSSAPSHLLLAATLEETDQVRNAWFWWSGVRFLSVR